MENGKLKMEKSFLAMALCFMASLLGFTSCQDSGNWSDDATTYSKGGKPGAYGNDTITEHNVVTLAQLRAMSKYKSVLTQYRDYKLVDDDIQLKVRVTGNDAGGNIYNKVAVQDENGDAILICVYSGGLFSYLPVGQEILVNLKDLYIGTYGYQQQIGTPYTTSSGNTYPGRMAASLWQKHFKLIGTPNASAANIQPIEFTAAIQKDMTNYAGRLMKLTHVKMQNANSKDPNKRKWAAEDDSNFSISQPIGGYPSTVVVYTSTSAKFANDTIPSGYVDITGVFSRYSSTWQIQLRTADDVKASTTN